MYFVDRELLEKRLVYLEENMKVFSESKEWVSEVEKAALERISHMLIETITDTGNQMIDGFIMRDPGSYNDIIDILVDEKVISKPEGDSLKRVFAWRKPLLQEYTNIDHKKLHDSMLAESTALLNYPGKVRRYIENELGPVSAFLPQKD